MGHWLQTKRRIDALVRDAKPDVVHMHVTGSNAWYARYAANAGGCPLVITTHGSPDRALNASGLAAERKLCESATFLTHCSTGAMEQFLLKHPTLQTTSSVIYNGIDVDSFEPLPMELRHGILYAGRLAPGKGVEILLEAAAAPELTSQSILIAGDGPARGSLEKMAKDHKLKNVKFCGLVPYHELKSLLASTALFTLPSFTEGFPMSVLEAMAASAPIVATTVGGIPEQIVNEQSGLLIPPRSAASLQEALVRLVQNPQLAAQFGSVARDDAKARFDWRIIGGQYEDTYQKAIQQSRGAR